jgi:hypothetical protein
LDAAVHREGELDVHDRARHTAQAGQRLGEAGGFARREGVVEAGEELVGDQVDELVGERPADGG